MYVYYTLRKVFCLNNNQYYFLHSLTVLNTQWIIFKENIPDFQINLYCIFLQFCKYPPIYRYAGTAEDCAERVSREAQRRHFSSVVVMSCDEYPIEKIFDEKLILFFIATTGQGDHPDNMRSFFRSILNRKLQSGDFGFVTLLCNWDWSWWDSRQLFWRVCSTMGSTSSRQASIEFSTWKRTLAGLFWFLITTVV